MIALIYVVYSGEHDALSTAVVATIFGMFGGGYGSTSKLKR